MAHLIVFLSGCLALALGGITSRDLVYTCLGVFLLEMTKAILDKDGLG